MAVGKKVYLCLSAVVCFSCAADVIGGGTSEAADSTGNPRMDQRVAAVRDLMMHLGGLHHLLVLTCWPTALRYKLWMALQRHATSELAPIAVQFGSVDTRNLPWNDRNQHLVVVLVDLACPNTDHLLQHAGQLLYYRIRWIVLHSTVMTDHVDTTPPDNGWRNCSEYAAMLDPLPLLISNELYYFCTDPSTGRHLLRQQYRLSTSNQPTECIIETRGSWEPAPGGLTLFTGETQADRRRMLVTSVRRQNMHGFQLRASIVILHNETLNHLDDLHDKHVDTISRVNYQNTKAIAIALNATVRFTFVNSWGYQDPETGRYNGMVGELQNDLADLGGTSLFFTQERIPIIDYLSMTSPTKIRFVFRAPKLSFTDNVFVLPFHQHVWFCTIGFILLSGALLAVVLHTEQRYTVGSGDTGGTPIQFSDALLNVFGTTCQQGSFIEPRSTSSRCLILLCLVVLMFLYASYSANIVALIQSPSTKIQTLSDLLSSRLKTGAEDTVYNRYYLKNEMEPISKALYERKMRNKDGTENFLSLAQGVEAIRQGHYAFFAELGVSYKLISETFQEEEKCGLQELEYMRVIDPYYAIRKNCSFREPIRITLFKLREFGIQGRENTLLYSKKPKCSGGTSFTPVSLVDVWPALVTLGWGYLLTVLLFIAEQIWYRASRTLLPTGSYFRW